MLSKQEIESELSRYLQEMFDIPAAKILPEARLSEDLDLDSIDAIDLMVKLQELTGLKIAAADFKSVRTVGDVVEKVYVQLAKRT